MANIEMKTLQFPDNPNIFEIVDNKARQDLITLDQEKVELKTFATGEGGVEQVDAKLILDSYDTYEGAIIQFYSNEQLPAHLVSYGFVMTDLDRVTKYLIEIDRDGIITKWTKETNYRVNSIPDEAIGSKLLNYKESLPFVTQGKTATIKQIDVDKKLNREEILNILNKFAIDIGGYKTIYTVNTDTNSTFSIIILKPSAKDYCILAGINDTQTLYPPCIWSSSDLGPIGDLLPTGAKSGWNINGEIKFLFVKENNVSGNDLNAEGITQEDLTNIMPIMFVRKKGITKLYNFTNGVLDETREVEISAKVVNGVIYEELIK